ncbi:serine-rich adhesin for platelets [Lucilia sericata]|uniref:serine-rich adhesin for platelets n=1 Tax=Lucilia sericata TaxID=13632 RepID=UPI0018A83C5F|nr:serine-rich adhesin for platelets [Lucilia sericata]XP_037810731.1 serine-rich adhesin for platelets [Lucilia sericata]XP_037810740.1 serine-rich adhesin for platelets [Lucilia sericata]XP_037810748.1 serine-rich adhesin for platelets [Lucilia sericata]
MKETDTETSVIWPSWCYTDNIHRNVLKECVEIEKDLYTNINRESNVLSLGNITDTQEVTREREHIKSTSGCITSQTPTPPTAPIAPPSITPITIVGEKKMLSERSLLLSGYSNNNTIDSVKTNCEKSNTPPLSGDTSPVQGAGLTITPTTTAAAAAAYLYLEKVKNERMSPRVTAAQLDSLKDAIMESSAAAAAVAAAMVNNNNSNSINNNNNHNNSNSINNNSSIGSGSGSASNCSNSSSSINNNLVNSQLQNQIANNSINNTSDELQSHSLAQSCSQTHQQQQQHQFQIQKQSHQHHLHHQTQQQSLHMSSNHVKKERLSPGTNGDLQTTLSRSRSTTPSSFRGTSPQQSVHSSPSETLVPMHNLSTNLLNSIHQAAASSRHGNLSVSSPGITNANSGLPADFPTRNYSDFMRSLAAKYNNANPNDNLKRNALFEATSNNINSQKKASTAAQKTSYAPSPTAPINKEVSITTTSTLPPPPPLTSAAISPGESALKLTQQNKLAAAVANAAAACTSNVSPYMTSFLSSLPFSSGIFPPLIDMSSTQALITLARAAKENEIHNILSASSQHPKRSAASNSPSPSPSLNMALQQAAQFISPALIYSAQLQKQQLQQQQQASRQSSPRLANISNSTTTSSTSAKNNRNLGDKLNVSPLDLSSQPPASKRFKAESTSSQSSNDGLIHTTITRRASSSTATTSPSPPPLNEKSLNMNASIASPAATASAVVGSSTKTEATTTAFTPIKVASSTSATSSIAPAVTVRQCQAQSEELNSWTVDDVCAFVGSIDICAEYVKHFREQCIDGSGLPLLTEDHLVNSLGMKLGPALKLRSVLAKKLGGPCPCVSCVAQVQQVLALQTGGMTAAAATIATPTTTSDHTTSSSSANVTAIGSSSNSSGSCNSHLPKNPLSTSSSTNCSNYNSSNSVNKNESTTAATTTTSSTNTIFTNSSTTNVCNNDANTNNTPRSNSNCNTNVGHFSSPPPSSSAAAATAPITQQPQQHHLHQQQHSPSQNICSNDNSNPTTYRHDNADSSS